MAVMRPQRVEVEIGDLVLHGFDPADRQRIGEALADELRQLIARELQHERGSSDAAVLEPAAAPLLYAGTLRIDGARPERTGRAIARQVHALLIAGDSHAATRPARDRPNLAATPRQRGGDGS